MNADHQAQLRLLEIQELDTSLDRLEHRRGSLPEAAELERLTERVDELRKSIVTADTDITDLAREQTKAEGSVDQVRQRVERDSKRLDSGQIAAARELESLQSEIESLRRRQSSLEDEVLEIMERREQAEARRAEFAAEHEQLGGEQERARERYDVAVGELDEEVAELRRQRGALASDVPDDLLTLYDKLRSQHGGVGAAALHRGRCDGCKLSLSTADLGEIRAAADDDVLRCPECRRLLVRTAESGL